MTLTVPWHPAEPITRPAVRLGRSLSVDRWIWVLFGLHVVLVLALASRLLGTELVGDEVAYVDGGRALSNLLRDLVTLHGPDWPELRQSLVGSGWFMPGMALVLTPLSLVAPAAGVAVTRLYLAALSSVVLLLVARRVRARLGGRLGDAAALTLLVLPGLVPMWVVFSFTAWGDLWAGFAVVLLFVEAFVMVRTTARGGAIGWRSGLGLGLVAIATLYLRSSTQLLVLGVLVLVAIALVVLRRSLRASAPVVVAAAVFVALLLPWSLTASSALDSRVITTTSTATALGNTFGDPREVCFGPCDPDSPFWFAPVRYARETARATGTSETEVLGEMSAYSRRDVTPRSYARQVGVNTGRLLGAPWGYEDGLRAPGVGGGVAATAIALGTALLFFPALLMLFGALVGVVRGPLERQVWALLVKVMALGLLVQPFVHMASSRYWPTLAPVLALALVGVCWPRGEPADSWAAPPRLALRVVTGAQVVGSLVTLGAVASLVTLAVVG